MTQATLLATDTAAPPAGDFAHLPIDHVWADPDQPRRRFDKEFLVQLAESIKTQGVIQPIVVRLSSPAMAGRPRDKQTFTIISGESRWRASKMAEKATIPAHIRYDLTDADVAVMQILENLQRRDLTLIETCEGVTRLVKEIGFDKAVAQLGMSASWVSRHSTLHELPPEVLDLVKAGKVESIEMAKDVGQLVSLDPKKGNVIVGRLAGKLSVHGQTLEGIDLAPDPEELEDLNEEERQAELDAHQAHLERMQKQPTRVEIRASLREARQAAERKAAAKEARTAEKKDPEAQNRREKERKAEEKAKAERAARQQAEVASQDYAKGMTGDLCKAIGITPPRWQTYGYDYNAPVTVRPGHSQQSNDPDRMDYDLRLYQVDVALMTRVAPVATEPPPIQISLDGRVTLEEARALEKLLGTKRVRFSTTVALKGAAMKQAIAQLASPPVAAKPKKAEPVDGALSLNDFIAKRVKKKAGSRVKAADFYAAYEKHCKATKATALPFTSNEFGAVVEAQGIEKKRLNSGVHYLDIEVKA